MMYQSTEKQMGIWDYYFVNHYEEVFAFDIWRFQSSEIYVEAIKGMHGTYEFVR